MFDVGMFELLLIMLMGLVVLGPERLPEAARLIGAWLSKTKRTMTDIKIGVEREVHAHEMRERIKSELEKAGLNDLKEKFETQEAQFREQLKSGEKMLTDDSHQAQPQTTEDEHCTEDYGCEAAEDAAHDQGSTSASEPNKPASTSSTNSQANPPQRGAP